MQLSIVAKTIGLLLMVFSFAQVPPIIVDLIYSEGEYFSFLLSFALTGLGGLILWWPFKDTKKDLPLPEGVVVGAIVRDNELLMGSKKLVIESGDHILMVLMDVRKIHEVEALFLESEQ